MTYDNRSFIRRALHNAKVGDVSRVQRAGLDRVTLEAELQLISRARNNAFSIQDEGDGFLVTRLPDPPKGDYPFHTLTEIGSSFLRALEPKQMQSMRTAASRYMKANPGVFIRCTVEPGGMRATRRAPDDTSGVGRAPLPPEQHKYPFTSLDVGEAVLINLPPTEHGKIRSSVSARGRATGHKYTCRVEGDALRVTRTA